MSALSAPSSSTMPRVDPIQRMLSKLPHDLREFAALIRLPSNHGGLDAISISEKMVDVAARIDRAIDLWPLAPTESAALLEAALPLMRWFGQHLKASNSRTDRHRAGGILQYADFIAYVLGRLDLS